MTDAYTILTNAAFKYSALSETEKAVIGELCKSEGQQSIYAFAKNKKILPFIAVLLTGMAIDKAFWSPVAEEYRKRNETVIRCLDRVFTKLSENGIKKIFVSENFGALLSADADKALFASGDIDMYGDPAEKEGIYLSFEQLGYTKKERYSGRKLISTNFYNPSVLPENFHFGVAWHPLSRMKLPCFINADDFVDWENLVSYQNTAIKMPDIEALMYICLLHISLHSYSRAPDIRLYMDIGNLSHLPVDWEKILDFAQRDKTVARVLTVSYLANKLIMVEVPGNVLDLVTSPAYKKQVSKLLKLVYDEGRNCLLFEPKRMKVLRIEALSDSVRFVEGIKKILLPDKAWIREVYTGNSGSIVTGYIKHIVNVF